MGPSLGDYLLIGMIAAAATAAATPFVAYAARVRGWMAEPNERSVHVLAIPNVGGVAMVIGLAVAMMVAVLLGRFDAVLGDGREILGVVIAAVVVLTIGVADDLIDLPPPAKVTGIVGAALVLLWFGVTMFYFRVPFVDVFVLSSDWQPVVTVVWLLGMTQAINLIDGLDGLAAGIVAIASAAFFLYAWRLGELDLLSQPNPGPLIAVVTAGISVGFLPFNFNPARIFMGDGGAFVLGLLMAASTSVVGGRATPGSQEFVGQTFFFLAPLVLPLLILGVPVLDTLFAIVRRISKRQAIDVADKGHLHHRLMNLGHGHRRSVAILWAWTLVLSGFVLYPVLTDQNPTYLPFGMAAIALVLFTVLHPSVRRKRTEEIEAALDRPAAEQIRPR